MSASVALRAPGEPTPRARRASPDPVDLILDCHDRIRAFLAAACRVASAGAEVDPEIVADAAHRVSTYFAMGFALHSLDEDVSLAPRISPFPMTERSRQDLLRMAREHAFLERAAVEIVRASRAVAVMPAHHEPRAILASHLTRFVPTVLTHLAMEERTVLHVARARLSAKDRVRIAEEMDARRSSSEARRDAPPPGDDLR